MNALFVITGLGIVSLLAEFGNLKRWLTAFVIIGMIAAVGLAVADWIHHGDEATMYFSNMLVFDNLALAFTILIGLATIIWFWLSADYFATQTHRTDRTSLVVFAVVGSVIMSSFNNMAMLFLGIEILSMSLYVLAGSKKDSLTSTEAAFKYFLMGSFATGFLLFGIALIYGATGSFHIHTIAETLTANPTGFPTFFYAGILLMMIGLAFKISAVPFHFWAPDVYSGAPTTITAFMSTVVKVAAIAAFIRIFSTCFVAAASTWTTVLTVITVLTLVIPNVTAVYQTYVKRILAYSSVGHVGYILLAFIANPSGTDTIFYYLATYTVASLAAFSVLHLVEGPAEETTIDYFNGLYKKNAWLAVTMTIALLSLAGIPPLAGFFGKYLVFAQAINHGYTSLVIVAVITSLIGVYYYFRIIIAMYFREPEGATIEIRGSHKALFFVLIVLSFALGLFPDAVLKLVTGF
ncbi:MAG TPA: NADH-quinone oxidoreductase subunit N [Ohtaekwangia sp.]|uniref:NADH-quinone oxidoreductase subunit N n=1 Tax=Ohtaekwangia sp. TaxID=2066019 RepID=UPI002F94D91A